MSSMPKYKYQCNRCHEEWDTWHRIDENPSPCACGEQQNLERLPSVYTRNKKVDVEKKIGEETNQYIEDARNALKNQKSEAAQEEIK